MRIVAQVEMSEKGVKRIFIALDREGLESLRKDLDPRNFRKPMNSLDLFTEEWGGYDLDSEPVLEGCEVVNHLEFLYLGDGSEEDKTTDN